ncbi:MAG: TonB family protein [Proteobacteria bacterium]|nr:TonB family protein [Pseudomonadota bacterium]
MKGNDKLRFAIAIFVSFLAHATAVFLLFPLYGIIRAIRVLFEEENEVLRVTLILAILLHIAILLPLIHWIVSAEDMEGGQLVDVELWDEEKREPEEEKTPEELLEEYEPDEEIPEGQVVEAPPSPDQRRPDKPRFLAEQDARVEKETRARIRRPATGHAVSSPARVGTGLDSETSKGGMAAELSGPPLPEHMQKADDGQRAVERRAPPSPMDINLKPSMETLASALAGTGLDHLENVASADATALNTASWKYASFFNRVKSRVERYWHPALEYKKHDPYGNVYGFKDRKTALLVVLRGDGSVKKVYVMEPSGTFFLDDEAKEAVEKAAPFPNVPPGLIDKKDGLVTFTFYFLVTVGEQPIFRMRRYR